MISDASTVRVAHESFRGFRGDDSGNLCVVPPAAGLPTRKFLTAAGDGSGAFNLNGNYSASALTAHYVTPVRYEICSVLITVSDATKFTQEAYGGIAEGGVTNGVRMYIQTAEGLTVSLLTEYGIKANRQWLEVSSDVVITSFEGTAQTMRIVIDLPNQFGRYLTLNAGDQLKVVLNDDFSGLTSHTFMLRGTQYVTT